VTSTGTLEERVAALESLIVSPAAEPEWTDGQVAEFRKALAAGAGDSKVDLLPPRRLVGVADVRQVLRECVTVVKPGETLIIRGDRDWTPNQAEEVQQRFDAAVDFWKLCFRVLVVPGDELGVAENAS
jgi:hypothetical protein